MSSQPLRINTERLRRDIESLAAIGQDKDLGIYRMAFTPADMQAREWLRERIREADLDDYQDGAANIHARLGWDHKRPAVVTGSHIDTVPGAGRLDGALGVLCGLEALRVIREQDLPLTHPMELVAFSDEEGRFGGMFGSQAMAGALTPEDIHTAEDLDGVTLIQAMAEQGLDAMDALTAVRPAESIKAFIEMHIEQGPVLDREGVPIGIVEGITGLKRWQVRIIGTANHAGTTPMDGRRDAFQGLAEFSANIDRVLEEYGSPLSVATIGQVELLPGAVNVVPGEAHFSLEFRDTDPQIIVSLEDAFRRSLSAIARRRGLMFEFEETSHLHPVPCDAGIRQLLEALALELDYPVHHLPSGAAHDTQQIARIAPAGMIFVPSREGRSHSAAEWTAWPHIEAGANLLLNSLYRLAS